MKPHILVPTMNRQPPGPWTSRLCTVGLLCCLAFLPACAKNRVEDRIWKGAQRVLEHIEEPSIPDREIDLIAYAGTAPDETGSFDFQPAIDQALESLAAMGGGRLLFPYPDGYQMGEVELVYRVRGPINLRENTALHFARGIRVLFEFDPPSYRPGGQGVLSRYEGTLLYTHSPLIRAFNVSNFEIRGMPGDGPLPVLDGDGARWREWEVQGNVERGESQDGRHASYQLAKEVNNEDVPVPERRFDKEYLRPPLVQFMACRQGLVEDLKLVNSPFWTVHPLFSENLVFRRLEFEALVPNNDGIDPETSRYILIEDIDFHNADDNIAIKSGRDLEGREGVLVAGTELEGLDLPFIENGRIGGPTRHVLIRNCRFRGHYAVCIGSEMSGGVHDIYVLDNRSDHSVRMGFFIKGGRNRGGVVSDVYVRNLELNEVEREVLKLVPNYDNDLTSPWPSKFRRITVENMKVKKARSGIRVFGWADATIDEVLLRNIEVGAIQEGAPLEFNNTQNLVLENVVIGGTSLDGVYTALDEDATVPSSR